MRLPLLIAISPQTSRARSIGPDGFGGDSRMTALRADEDRRWV